jgi:P-type Cu+ transporter
MLISFFLFSVAFAHGSQVTITSASFVLLQTKAPLESVLEVILLSRKVYRRQKVCFYDFILYMDILTSLLDELWLGYGL